MGLVEFGNTWWGKKWLDALEGVDYGNRLPRGKRYARNGSVESMTWTGNRVVADVQGSLPFPYTVSMKLELFSNKHKTSVLRAMTGNPAVLSQLLARKLPKSLLESFEKDKVPIFPNSWREIKADCSCPDWAHCCKHIAAIIYLIANEIDADPFRLFEIHGMDVFASLKRKGFKVDQHRAISIAKPSHSFIKSLEQSAPDLTPNEIQSRIRKLDLSKIPNCREQVLSLLTEKPRFYPHGDFKKLLSEALVRFSRQAARNSAKWAAGHQADNDLPMFTSVDIGVKRDLRLDKLALTDQSGNELDLDLVKRDERVIEILRILYGTPLKEIHLHDKKAITLSLITQFAMRLIEQSAIQPEFFAIRGGYRIGWAPARVFPQVESAFRGICEIATTNLITSPKLSRANQVKTVLSGIIGVLIAEWSQNRRDLTFYPVPAMFFAGETFNPENHYGYADSAEMLGLWLSRFQISAKRHVPVIELKEDLRGDDDFSLSVQIQDRDEDLAAPVPLTDILSNRKFTRIRFEIMKDLAVLADNLPEILDCLDNTADHTVGLDAIGAQTFLFQRLPTLRLLRIPVLIPKSLNKIVRPIKSARVSVRKDATSGSNRLSLERMLDFEWRIALGDDLVSFSEFTRLVSGLSGIVKITDQYVFLDGDEVEKLIEDMRSDQKLSRNEILQAVIAEEHKDCPLLLSKEVKKEIGLLLNAEPMNLPSLLNAQLREYQGRGFDWLVKNEKLGFGSLIADDMGLGKTVQVIAFLLYLYELGRLVRNPALVIVPTTLLTNWRREAERFAPDLRVATYHGSGRVLDTASADVVLTTYGVVRRDNEELRKVKWSALIIDEAQGIKNSSTEQTRSIKRLKGDCRVAMTGTPVENRLSEFWSILDFLNKGFLQTEKAFFNKFALPIEVHRNQKQLELFRKITAPFVLRRLKTDKSIIQDLPDKLEFDQYCSLTANQAAIYENVTESILETIENSEGIERRGLVFKLITSLKQICNHPSHYLKGKGLRTATESGKSALTLDLLRAIRDNGEKALIFTQFAEMGILLQELIMKEFSIDAPFLHGGVTLKKRSEMVDKFESEPWIPFFILSLKAGGTGLNLTAANNVIHYDLWWNPAVEAQATDRAFRIGQKKNVMVRRLISKGTFEEKINDMLKSKKELSDLAVGVGEQWIGELNDSDLKDVFTLAKG